MKAEHSPEIKKPLVEETQTLFMQYQRHMYFLGYCHWYHFTRSILAGITTCACMLHTEMDDWACGNFFIVFNENFMLN